ncbi:MAG: NIL domain-containing protein [Candidatus Omnitrophica bacterium]|nr:NIL domain-containing protein [Candidatus Omnitrophota bacterium]
MEDTRIELFIPGELKDEPVICDMLKNFSVHIKIIEASFSSERGWALLDLRGEKSEVDRMLDHLRKKGISVELR